MTLRHPARHRANPLIEQSPMNGDGHYGLYAAARTRFSGRGAGDDGGRPRAGREERSVWSFAGERQFPAGLSRAATRARQEARWPRVRRSSHAILSRSDTTERLDCGRSRPAAPLRVATGISPHGVQRAG